MSLSTTTQVYHLKDLREYILSGKADFPNDYTLVANVDDTITDLEKIFELTNNIEHNWGLNRGVYSLFLKNRSTSVGDVIVKAGVAYIVENMGFKELPVSVL